MLSTVNWERLWRMSGITFVVLFILAYIIYGSQPKVGAGPAKLVSFYDGDRTRILIATVILGIAVLNLLWFGAALNSALRDAGQGGWGAAATASSTAVGAILWVIIAVSSALAYSIAGSGNIPLTSGLNDVLWVSTVIVSFPAAMLVMSGSFGLWRAGLISNQLFYAGVAAVVLVLLGGTTWASDGFWAPDGAYSQFITLIIFLAWVGGFSWLLANLSTARAPERAAVPTP
jgi:hypothetical protein